MERYRWNISQLIFKNVQNDVCGTAVSWDFTKLGVPSDAEKVASQICQKFVFLLLSFVYIYNLLCVRWNTQFREIQTDCRSTDVISNIFENQLTGVPPVAFYDHEI